MKVVQMSFQKNLVLGLFVGLMPSFVQAAGAEVRLRGTVFSDYRTGLTRYDLKVKGAAGGIYVLKGQAMANRESLLAGRTRVTFDSVEVEKEIETPSGLVTDTYENRGELLRYPFDREIDGTVYLAGVPVSGRYRTAAINSGLEWESLSFDGNRSSGRLDYNSFNGYYRPKNGMRLGSYRVSAGGRGDFAFNLDHYFGQNVLHTDFVFGSIQARGVVQYSDTTESHTECSTDSEGDTSCHTQTDVVARTGTFDWKLRSQEDRELVLSDRPGTDGTDDSAVRALLAWIELVAYDLR